MTLLNDILSSKVRSEIFRLLFGLNQDALHLRDIERKSGLRISTIRQDMKKLLRIDLVAARRDGNRLYYRANIDHPLYDDIRKLVIKSSGLVDILREALEKDRIRVAFIFGSFAGGQPHATSDVDMMVIGEIGLRELTGWLKLHETSKKEISNLLAVVERELSDAGKDISPDGKFAHAYNAALQLCTIALHVEGYRSQKTLQYYRTTQALPLILGGKRKSDADYLDTCRKKRNIIEYEHIGSVTEADTDELIAMARELRVDILNWLREKHNDLITL